MSKDFEADAESILNAAISPVCRICVGVMRKTDRRMERIESGADNLRKSVESIRVDDLRQSVGQIQGQLTQILQRFDNFSDRTVRHIERSDKRWERLEVRVQKIEDLEEADHSEKKRSQVRWDNAVSALLGAAIAYGVPMLLKALT